MPIRGKFPCRLSLDSIGIKRDFKEVTKFIVINIKPYNVILRISF
jgi:hypothetical protein